MTGGGPQIGTQTLPLLIYKEAFGQLHLGRGAAIAILMLMIMTVMFLVYLWYVQPRREEGGAMTAVAVRIVGKAARVSLVWPASSPSPSPCCGPC